MIKGLFINNVKAKDSIYESGLMVYDCLRLSEQFLLDYKEVSAAQRNIPAEYDFYLFNYHPSTMHWLDTARLKKSLGLVFTIILEVLPDDPFVMCPDNHFNGYCVLDPTIRSSNKKVFAFPRPLEIPEKVIPYQEKKIPVIGSFGFATKGKGFQHVVEAVNQEFDQAVVKINIPFGDFVPESKAYAEFLAGICRQKAKPGIEVIVTHAYMTKEELINWCAQNTLNCFLYDRNLPGLAATTDQAIASGRPLAVSQNDTFRHILSYISPYPAVSLKQSIENSTIQVQRMEKDWSPVVFSAKFDIMLSQLLKKHSTNDISTGDFNLPLLKKGVTETLKRKYRKYKRFLNWKKLQHFLVAKKKIKDEELI